MGRIVLAAKVSHVPSMLLSEMPGPVSGLRSESIAAQHEIGRRAREAGADTFVVLDTHWLVNSGYHINANPRHHGVFTSTEFPHFIRDLAFDLPGNSDLGRRIADEATARGVLTRAHDDIASLQLQYGTLVPMRYMNADSELRVISVAGWMYDAEIEESRTVGEAIRAAVEACDTKVALIASGSLSHRIWPNRQVEQGLQAVSRPFNRLVDQLVLDLWREGRSRDFTDMLPDYAAHCAGEGHMHDTAMLFGALGWDTYEGKAEVLTDWFASSGTGQCNVLFPV